MFTWPLYTALLQHAYNDEMVLVTPTATGLDCYAVTLNDDSLRLVKASPQAAIVLLAELLQGRRAQLARQAHR